MAKEFFKEINVSQDFFQKVLEQGVSLFDYDKIKDDFLRFYEKTLNTIKDQELKKKVKLLLLFIFSYGKIIINNNHLLGNIKINSTNFHVDVLHKETKDYQDFLLVRTMFKENDDLIKEEIIFKTYFDNSYLITRDNFASKDDLKKELVSEKLLSSDGTVLKDKKMESETRISFIDKIIREITKEKGYSIINKDDFSLKKEIKSNLIVYPNSNHCFYNETNNYLKREKNNDYEEITLEEYQELINDSKLKERK